MCVLVCFLQYSSQRPGTSGMLWGIDVEGSNKPPEQSLIKTAVLFLKILYCPRNRRVWQEY